MEIHTLFWNYGWMHHPLPLLCYPSGCSCFWRLWLWLWFATGRGPFAVSKWQGQHDVEGRTRYPSHHIKMAMRRCGGASPPHRVEMARTRAHFSLYRDGNDMTEGHTPLTVSKWQRQYDEEGRTPPRHCSVGFRVVVSKRNKFFFFGRTL